MTEAIERILNYTSGGREPFFQKPMIVERRREGPAEAPRGGKPFVDQVTGTIRSSHHKRNWT
jgi:hypothetical protein